MIPSLGDIWKINNSTNGFVINVNDEVIELICKDSITKKVFVFKEKLIKSKDINERFSLFCKHYEYKGKSKIIDLLFETE